MAAGVIMTKISSVTQMEGVLSFPQFDVFGVENALS